MDQMEVMEYRLLALMLNMHKILQLLPLQQLDGLQQLQLGLMENIFGQEQKQYYQVALQNTLILRV